MSSYLFLSAHQPQTLVLYSVVNKKERFHMSEMVVLSYRTRREIVAQIAPRYREASLARKRVMLDSLVEMTGYARKYAIELLNQET